MAKFKARARTLDLLGRQQIAGIPTAINELFKNAHDAYADNVEVDYFRKDRLFILRDDGLGMTREDFETRWLTIGTESKFENSKMSAPPKDPDKQERPIMGEKGIGRLAIASIGRQVLILTRAKRVGESHKIIAALINWGIFELAGLNLDDINIPVREFQDLPTLMDLNEMKDEAMFSIRELVKRGEIEPKEAEPIISEISNFKVSPFELDKTLPNQITLKNHGSGTQFYISPVDETLNYDIDGEKEGNNSTKIEKMLIGFTNTMTPGHPTPLISAAFRDYRSTDNTYYNILDKDIFFTPDDFIVADHHVQGTFDEYGQFSGNVMIYNEKNYDHIVNWNGNNFRKTECGTFNINFSYIQGKLRQSIITPEEHSRLIAKTDKFGGLYIYRDNIRILPYGNSDYDFLDIEKNRTKSASYYFFSFRRMFGVINITKKVNFQLKEKAGREGFIENKAYRQMREILKNLFIQLAADFFREGGGPKASFWLEKRDERDRFYRAIELRDKQAKVRKEKFQKSLDDFFNDVTRKNFENQVADFLLETEKNISSVSYITDSEEASRAIIDIESNARQKLNSLRQNAKIKEPRGFGMSKDLRKDWEAYISEFEVLNSNIYVKAENEIDELISVYTNRLNIEISKRKRLEQAVDNISIEARKATSAVGKETAIALSMTASKVKELASDLMISLEDKISAIKEQFSRLHFENSDDFDLVTERKRMEEEILQEKNRSTEILESVISQLEAISWQRGTDGYLITSSEMNDALTDELYDLRDRVQTDIELSQLGLAVGVIHHEFNSTVTSMRNSIKELKAWADVNDKLDNVYNNLRINFEHLDGYLGLFTPLNRRLNRQVENILANDINIFLLDLFKPRLERHNITLKHTQGFSKQSLKGYRSTFYPVFVNIVDNAIYWLKQKNTDGDRIIRLHADDSGFYISNNGPEILLKDKDRIFELGFTRKPEGRGMGLHISQEVLDGVNYTIIVDEPRDQSTVTFKIQPKNQG